MTMPMSRVEKLRTEHAGRIARSLSYGIVPWQRSELPVAPPQSTVSGNSYGGLNALYLTGKCLEGGYKDPRFITASEANRLDLWVKKGEHGVHLEHWSQGKEGTTNKPEVQIYTVFNVEQLSGDLSRLPTQPPTQDAANLEKAREMLKSTGVELSPESRAQEYREAVKNLVSKFAEGAGYHQDVHTPELMALRANLASTTVMREMCVPVKQPDGLPTKLWASSIQHDPSQLYKAIRDGSDIAKGVMASMTQEREVHLQRATQQRGEAQKAQEAIAEALTVPRGADFNLPDADLSGTQETVVAATEKAAAQVSELRASASRHEADASPNKIAEAWVVVQKHLGSGAIVTSAQPGRSYGGKIVGVLDSGPDKIAIQAISDNHAVLHTVKDSAAKSSLKIGEEMNLSAGEDWNSVAQTKQAELAREGMRR